MLGLSAATRRQSGHLLKRRGGRFHTWRKDARQPLTERNSRDPIPVRTCTRTEVGTAHPAVPHFWLCDGRLLVLTDPANENNIGLFKVREQSGYKSLNVLSLVQVAFFSWTNV